MHPATMMVTPRAIFHVIDSLRTMAARHMAMTGLRKKAYEAYVAPARSTARMKQK